MTHDDGQSIHYGYDALGNRTSLETQINGVTETNVDYTYDALNRVQTVTDTIGTPATTTFDYNPLGQMTSISRPNDVVTNYTYDPQRYFVDEIEHLNGSTVLGRYEYDYDNVGNRTDMTLTAGDGSVTDISYDYDRANRLIEETYNLLGAESSTFYQYDRAGNRSHMINDEGTTHYIYNADDELTKVNLPNYYYEEYEYDARGNLTQVHSYGHGNASFQHYNYNARDQLVSFELSSVETPSTPTVTYEYDYKGNRIAETISGSTRDYLWDEFSQFGDVILETTLNTSISYTLADGMLISQSNNGNVGYFLQDAQGSTIGFADDTGLLTSEYSYDAFGNLDESIDPLSLETSYLYTGQQFDALYSELYNLRARQYDPSVGRFQTRDTYPYNYQNPFELNRYVYTANNPTTFVDPSGHSILQDFAQQIKATLSAAKIYPGYGALVGASVGALIGGIYAATTYAATSANMCGSRETGNLGNRILWGIVSGAIAGGIIGASGAVTAPVAAKIGTSIGLIVLSGIGLISAGSETVSDLQQGNGLNLCSAADAVVSVMGIFYGTRMLKAGIRESIAQAANSLIGRLMRISGLNKRPVDIGTMGIQTQRAGQAGILDYWIRLKGTLHTRTSGRGFFPNTSTPNSLRFTTFDGTVTGVIRRYAIYNNDGVLAYRVDLFGPAHGTIPTPHTLPSIINIRSDGAEFITPDTLPYQSFPWEIP